MVTQGTRRPALGLWMNGDFVGTWRLDAGGVDLLEYDAGWQVAAQGRPLSLSLPFIPSGRAHRGDAVRVYFENLLPDSEEIRLRAARRFRAKSTRAFDLLAQIGRDCVGALQILPDGQTPGDVRTIDATPLAEHEVAALLRGTVAAPAAAGGMPADDDDFRISIAGAQEKTALTWIDGRWCRPHGSTPTTHILKLPMGLVGNMKLDLSHSIENEWLCARIVAAFGLPVAKCEPLQFGDEKVLAVRRFDRVWRDGPSGRWLARLPQEDCCQATGTPPERKYESDGGPGIERIMGLLATSETPAADRRTFLSEHKIRLAMAIRSTNAHWRMKEIGRRHWLALGKRYGVLGDEGQTMETILDDWIARTPRLVAEVESSLPAGFPEQIAALVLRGLERAASQLAG